jgi:DNA repair exonuclease SbcCD ATPase subunit
MRVRALMKLGTSIALSGMFVALHGCATGISATVDDANLRVAAVHSDVRAVNDSVVTLEQRVDDLQARLSTLERENAALQQSLQQDQEALQASLAAALRTQQAALEQRVQAQLADAGRSTTVADAKISDVLRLVREENAKLQQRLNDDLLTMRADLKKLQNQVNSNTAAVDDLARELQTVVEVSASTACGPAAKKTPAAAASTSEPVVRTGTPSHPDIDYARGYEHAVKPGESLWKIARDYNVAVQDIVNCNDNINNASALTVGQKIFVPFRKQVEQQP